MNAISHVFSGATALSGAVALANPDALAALSDEDREAIAVELADKQARRAPAALPRITVDRAALTAAFATICKVADKRVTIPILANACIEASDGIAVVKATDLDIEISVMVEAQAESDFRMTAPAHLLESFLKKAGKSDTVTLTAPVTKSKERQRATGVWEAGKQVMETEAYDECDGPALVDFGRASYRVNCLPVSDFPDMTPGDLSHRFTMNGKEFWDMIDGTMAAMSKEETRYYLNGIFMHVKPGGNRDTLVLVATDGHKLYRQETTAPEGATPDLGGKKSEHIAHAGAILPRPLVELFHKLAKGKACPDAVQIAVGKDKVRLSFGNVEILSKLIDGTFPDYQRVIPTGNDKVMTVDRALFGEAIQSVSLISSERGRAVKLTIENELCRLDVNNPDSGSATATIDCGWEGGKPDEPLFLEIGVNYGYLADTLEDAAPDGGVIAFEFGDAGSPMVITGPREGWTGVLMPMRV